MAAGSINCLLMHEIENFIQSRCCHTKNYSACCGMRNLHLSWMKMTVFILTAMRTWILVYQECSRTLPAILYKGASTDTPIHHHYWQVQEGGSVVKRHTVCNSRTSKVVVECVRVASQRSPKHFVWEVCHRLDLPRSSVHDVLHKKTETACIQTPPLTQHLA
jgi:hypothetical protein